MKDLGLQKFTMGRHLSLRSEAMGHISSKKSLSFAQKDINSACEFIFLAEDEMGHGDGKQGDLCP